MKRNDNESFANYKLRRADENMRIKKINAETKSSGASSRETLRNAMRNAGTLIGTYGANLALHFASRRLAKPAYR